MVASGLQQNQADQKHMEYGRFRLILILWKFGEVSPSKTPVQEP